MHRRSSQQSYLRKGDGGGGGGQKGDCVREWGERGVEMGKGKEDR